VEDDPLYLKFWVKLIPLEQKRENLALTDPLLQKRRFKINIRS